MKTLHVLSILIVMLVGCSNASNKEEKNIAATEIKQTTTVAEIDTIFSFSGNKTGELPIGWSQYFTGRNGDTPNWQVVEDEGNKVLAQLTSNNPNYHFNDIVFNGFTVKNVDLKVKLKGVKGKKDQGGGFIWRFIDADNYYVLRANPLEDNVVLYKVENGKRTDLALLGKGETYGVDIAPLGNGWNNLRLKVVDQIFTVYLNGKELFRVEDNTFTNAGKIGLWTKADAVTYFDDLQVTKID